MDAGIDLLVLLDSGAPKDTGQQPVDFLALLDDDRSPDLQLQVVPAGTVAPRPDGNDADVAQEATCGNQQQAVVQFRSQAGRVGHGRHGGIFEKRLLTAHMRAAKLAKRTQAFSQDVCNLLEDSKFLTSSGSIIGVRAHSTSGGLVLQLSKRSSRGNRYRRSISWAEFLEAAYGRFKRNAALSVYLQKGQSTVKNMQVFVCAGFMNQQALSLAKLVSLAGAEKPLLVLKHMRFDETALMCSLNPDKGNHRSRSTWQTMVYRLRVAVVWESGATVVFPITLPPVVLISSGAPHQFYALQFHPSFRCVNGLLKLLQSNAHEAFDVLEADGASSNEKLFAHLYNLAVAEGKLISHARCMNHATQLINVAVLSSAEVDILGRLYGLTVFVRNLGYWGRLHQACRRWLEENLVFKPEAVSKAALPSATPQFREFLAYMQFWKDLESDAPDHENKRFREQAQRVLEMFNGDMVNAVCHVCTHTSLPIESRHCADRADCIRKAANALADLFLSSMPRVPVPSKWTTMFAPLDFCMGGFMMNSWLTHVFKLAFGTLVFAEFDPVDDQTDCRLVETLSFSAVNGRRFRNSLAFLSGRDSPWTVSLLVLVMEPCRCLTWYFLGSLKKSLARDRCVLYELLDPDVSVVAGLLQHLAALVMTRAGEGRMLMLFFGQYRSFEEFCGCEAGKVRQLRRMLLLTSGWIYRRQHTYVHSLRYAVAVLGDPGANADVLANVKHVWDATPSCCAPPGLARTLKLRGLTSEDLCSSRWRSILHTYASALQWSIADVEQKHAVNRQWAGSAFSTICAKFVNSEALLQRKQAQQRHDIQISGDSGAAGQSQARIRVKESSAKKGQGLKALSALELFRKDYLQRHMLTGSLNPCSKECWHAVREEFSQLSEEQRVIYESLADKSAVDAKVSRARRKQAPVRVPAPQSAGAIEDRGDAQTEQGKALVGRPSQPCHVPVLPFDDISKISSVTALRDKFQAVQTKAAPSKIALWLARPEPMASLVVRARISVGCYKLRICSDSRKGAQNARVCEDKPWEKAYRDPKL